MVLCLKARESRSLPGLKITDFFDAGWSSLVARQAHNLKVVGSNPAPATKFFSILFNFYATIGILNCIVNLIYQNLLRA